MSFSEATKGWVTPDETLLLTSGNMSSLLVSLENGGRVIDGINRIKRAMLSALTYPLFLLLLTFCIIIMVGIYLVPPLGEAAGNDVVWRGVAASLIAVSDFADKYWYIFAAVIWGVGLTVWLSLPIWTGKLRTLFDKFPPWSIYKLKLSVIDSSLKFSNN